MWVVLPQHTCRGPISMLYKTKAENQIHCLHRYYCWTTLMKRDFEAALKKHGRCDSSDAKALVEWSFRFMSGEPGMYMSYWYGGLHVVCEGWNELGLSDPKVDALLASPNLDLLRLYRNGSFHFQKDYFTHKFTQFQMEPKSVAWVRDLQDALGAWFLKWFDDHKTP